MLELFYRVDKSLYYRNLSHGKRPMIKKESQVSKQININLISPYVHSLFHFSHLCNHHFSITVILIGPATCSYKIAKFLGAFAKLQEKATSIFVMPVCLSVCPHGTRLSLDRFSLNLICACFFNSANKFFNASWTAHHSTNL